MASKFIKILIIGFIGLIFASIALYYIFPGTTSDLLIALERNIGGVSQKSLTVEGFRIEYLEGGQGDALLLLHGFGANKDNWTRWAKFLTPHFRLIIPDLPGFGQSTATPDIDYSIIAQVDRLKAFMTALGIKTFHIGGSSMGGGIAGTYASKYPEDVLSLILISPGGVVSSQTSEMQKLIKDLKQNPLISKNTDDYERMLDFVFNKKPFIPGVIKNRLAQHAIEHQPLNEIIWRQLVSYWNDHPLEKLLNGQKKPSLIIWGTHDRVLHVSGANILKEVMPNSQIALMDNVGHLPMIEDPKESAELYLSFLEKYKWVSR